MRSKLFLAAAIGGCVTAAAMAGDPVAPGSILPQGFSPKQLNDQQDVRAVLASATNAAVTKGGFDDLVERLSSADRKRMEGFADREFTELDGRIEQIRKNWEQKYGQSLNLDDSKLFEGFVTVYEGEVTDATTARAHWPVAVRPARDAAVNTVQSAEYLENGRNVAIVTVPTSHNLPAISVSMIHEVVDDWRIDIPDNVTGEQVYQGVKTALTIVGDNVAAWPSDVNEAQRMLGHRLLMALYNVPQDPDPKRAAAN